MSTPVYLNKKEVAALVGRSKQWIEEHSQFNNPREPVLKAVKVLGQYRWLQSDVEEFLAANTVTKG